MAQIIKHRRGSLEGLAAVTSSINKGELVIATGSSNLSVSNGSSIVFAAAADGQLQAVNRILIGTSEPNVFSNTTYNGLLNGVPYYDSVSGSLYILGSDSNTKLNLIGNIQPFSTSVDSRLDSLEAQVGGGGGGSLSSRVSGLESFTGSYATTGSNTFVSSQTIQGNIVLANNGQIRVQSNTADTLFGMFDGNNILGAYYQMWGNNHPTPDLTQRGSAEFVFDTRNGGGEFRIVEFDGSTWKKRFVVDRSGNTQVTGSLFVSGAISGSTLTGIGNVTAYSASIDSRLNQLSADSASQDARLDSLEAFSSSQEIKDNTLATLTGSIANEQAAQNTRLSIIESFTGSYATTGSNVYYGTQVITGSLYITNDLVVQGSSSLQNITASAVSIGTNIVKLNTATPAVRFGGIDVFDSGSQNATGSLYWDSLKNHWISIRPSSSTEIANSAALIYGPKHTGTIGDEPLLTTGKIPVAEGEDHIADSIMTQSGGNKITLSGSLDVLNEISASTINGLGNVAAFSQSLDSRLDTIETSLGGGGSIGARVSALESFSGSQEAKDSTLATYTASVNSRLNQLETNSGSQASQLSNLESFSGSQEAKNSTLSLYTASVDSHILNVNAYTASNDTTNTAQNNRLSSLEVFSGSQEAKDSTLAIYTASVDSKISQLIADSGSQAGRLNSLESFSGSQEAKNSTLATYTASINDNIANIHLFTSSFGTTFSSSVDSRLDTLEGTGTIQGLGTGNNVTFAKVTTSGDVVVGGDLVVQGNTVSLNTNTLTVEDKLITLASGSTSNLTADGAGFEIAGTNASFKYDGLNNEFSSSVAIVSNITGSLNVPGFGTSKRAAFRNAAGNLDFVAAPTTAGDLVQWNGTDFVMSNVIDGGQY
jgi:hypothetical protein